MTFVIILFAIGIVISAIQGFFGFVSSNESIRKNEQNPMLIEEPAEEQYGLEIFAESCGAHDYGHGHYNKNYPYDK